jgi:hypothetical protein
MRRSLPLLATLALGCGPNEVFVPLPALDGARALVLARHDGDHLLVAAHPLPPTGPLKMELAGGGMLEALLYQRALDELGLIPGPIAPASRDPRRRLEDADATLRLELDADGRSGAWTAGPPSTELSAFELEGTPSPCPRLVPDPISVSVGGAFLGLLPTPGGRAVTVTSFGEIYEIDGSGGFTQRNVPSVFSAGAFSVLPGGDLLIGGRSGSVWRVAPLGGAIPPATELPHLPSFEAVEAIDGGERGAALEIVAVLKNGEIHRFDGASWSLAGAFPTNPDAAPVASAVWVGPGEAFAASPHSGQIAHLIDGALTWETPPSQAGVTRLVRLDSIGLVAAESGGGLLIRRGASWERMPPNGNTLWVLSISRYGEGFVFGGPYGNLGIWMPSFGFCPLLQPISFFAEGTAQIDGGLLVVGSKNGSPVQEAALLVAR